MDNLDSRLLSINQKTAFQSSKFDSSSVLWLVGIKGRNFNRTGVRPETQKKLKWSRLKDFFDWGETGIRYYFNVSVRSLKNTFAQSWRLSAFWVLFWNEILGQDFINGQKYFSLTFKIIFFWKVHELHKLQLDHHHLFQELLYLHQLLKVFSKKATKNGKIFTVDLTLTKVNESWNKIVEP